METVICIVLVVGSSLLAFILGILIGYGSRPNRRGTGPGKP
jgi:hypothetical protein